MEPSNKYMFKHKGTYFAEDVTTAEYIDSLEDFEIRDSDVFVVSYPKSGTVWSQNILSLIYHEGHRDGTENINVIDRVPWLEYNIYNIDYVNCPSPRLFATHLPHNLVPRDLRNRRGKVIYVARNPKDVVVSYFHFSKLSLNLETISDFNILLERFLAGKGQVMHWITYLASWGGGDVVTRGPGPYPGLWCMLWRPLQYLHIELVSAPLPTVSWFLAHGWITSEAGSPTGMTSTFSSLPLRR
ncbi:amine sulfotransferase-like isoform X2 [Pelodiscus sinensis]|uniref:amine sulfotransferase-like isoform X2 n=1 Tax=Pelodiscus sinensis TaxID=13735 RepID=UPI003F6CC8B3